MKKGYLSDYFTGIAVKRLSQVEADPDASNQHEFNGVTGFKSILGTEKKKYPAFFIYFSENDEDTVTDEGFLTWYDAREKHLTRSEYRFYFPSTAVTDRAETEDMVFIGRRPDDSILVIVTQAHSTTENQLLWLFGIHDETLYDNFVVKGIADERNRDISFTSNFILDHLGIDTDEKDENYLEILLRKFPEGFPPTKIFSSFARDSIGELSPTEDPDVTLISLMEHEEMLFRTFENHIVGKCLEKNFDSVDSFIAFSLSVQNRRKSRVGHAFEHHMEFIFKENEIKYSRNKRTEGNSKPDFIFPGIEEYKDEGFQVEKLAMLGVKRTCKDRWRQILAEAQRIEDKHLATLEPGISRNQTDEMVSKKVRLVLPEAVHETYNKEQQDWLMTIGDFIEFIKYKS